MNFNLERRFEFLGKKCNTSICRSLTVKNNRLTKIFQLPISLGILDFSENLLEEIPTMDVWPTMNALLSLDLSKNRLGDNLKPGSFENLLTLRTLNLQANNLTKPPWEALSTLSSLQYLYMQVKKHEVLFCKKHNIYRSIY